MNASYLAVSSVLTLSQLIFQNFFPIPMPFAFPDVTIHFANSGAPVAVVA
jgi:hypothetical protein